MMMKAAGAHRFARAKRHAPRRIALACAVAAGSMGLAAGGAHAAAWTRQATIDARAVATDNSRPGTTEPKTSDLLLTLQPGLRLAADGARLSLRFDGSVAFRDSVRNTVDSSILPTVDGIMAATLVPQLVYLDASVRVRQSESDPFGARATDVAAENRHTTSEYRLTPAVRWRFAPRAQLLAWHEESFLVNTSAATGSSDGADVRGHRSVFQLERDPVPFGAGIELDRDDNRTTGSGLEQRITIEAARVQASYAITSADLIVGVVGGRERGTTEDLRFSDRLYGLALRWTPSGRTDVSARVEHRFFGTGGRLDARLRTPQTSLSMRAFREPVTASRAFGRGSVAMDAASLAAGVVARPAPTTPAEGEAVQTPAPAAPPPTRSLGEEALGHRGFPVALPGVIDIAAGYPQLGTGVDIRWVVIGRRHSVTFGAYTRIQRQITEGVTGTPPVADEDTRQSGGSVTVTRRLTPLTSLDFAVTGSRIVGLGSRFGDVTREGDVSVTLVTQLSPRTTLTTGVRYDRLSSTVASVRSSESTSLSVGLSHRF